MICFPLESRVWIRKSGISVDEMFKLLITSSFVSFTFSPSWKFFLFRPILPWIQARNCKLWKSHRMKTYTEESVGPWNTSSQTLSVTSKIDFSFLLFFLLHTFRSVNSDFVLPTLSRSEQSLPIIHSPTHYLSNYRHQLMTQKLGVSDDLADGSAVIQRWSFGISELKSSIDLPSFSNWQYILGNQKKIGEKVRNEKWRFFRERSNPKQWLLIWQFLKLFLRL